MLQSNYFLLNHGVLKTIGMLIYLLTQFVEFSEKHFSYLFLSYNIHSLMHLSADSYRFGPIHSYSAYRFFGINTEKTLEKKFFWKKPRKDLKENNTFLIFDFVMQVKMKH